MRVELWGAAVGAETPYELSYSYDWNGAAPAPYAHDGMIEIPSPLEESEWLYFTVFRGAWLSSRPMITAPSLVAVRLLLCCCLVACSDDDDDDAVGGEGEGEGERITQEIAADTGGTIEAEGLLVTIPPGALVADTTVTLRIGSRDAYPEAASLGSDVYELGPDGTTFQVPVEIAIDGDAAPEGATSSIGYLTSGAWMALAGASVEGGTVTAPTRHFTPFAVLWVGDVQLAGSCPAEPFVSCGGDVVGTWSFAGECTTLPIDFCDGAVYDAQAHRTSTLTFSPDGNFIVDGEVETNVLQSIPTSCFDGGDCTSNLGCPGDWASPCPEPPSGQCCTASESGDACERILHDVQSIVAAGTWSVAPLAFLRPGATPDNWEYCVDGDTLTLQSLRVSGGATYLTVYTYTRE